jgi:hypothetical protein
MDKTRFDGTFVHYTQSELSSDEASTMGYGLVFASLFVHQFFNLLFALKIHVLS